MHSLRFRFFISLVLVAAFALLALGLLARFVAYPALIERENNYADAEMARVESALNNDLDNLGGDTRDWAKWDYTYDFMVGGQPHYLQDNFSQEMFEDKHQLMRVFLDADGNTIQVIGVNPDNGHYSVCPDTHDECSWMEPFVDIIRTHILGQTSGLEKWLISIPMTAMVATSAIMPTSREDTPRGWLATIRQIDDDWFASIANQTGVNISIEPVLRPDQTYLTPPVLRLDGDRVMVSRFLKAEPGNSRLYVQAVLPRRDFINNWQTFSFVMLWTGVLWIITLVVILILLERMVLAPTRRLAHFTREQRHNNEFSETLPVTLVARHDEIGSLAREFQHLLFQQKARTESLEQLSQRDHLTGLYNRRYLDDYLMQTLLEGHRSKTPSGLLIIDIDYFKAYNDHYGHLEGDHCLVRVAQSLQRTLDDQGIMARIGGEEFIAVLPGVTREHLWRTAERLRRAVADLSLLHECSRVAPHITISLGMAMSLPEAPCQPAELIRLADESLYRAKQAGRNQVGARARDPQYHPTRSESDTL